jgi:hypothetical protein
VAIADVNMGSAGDLGEADGGEAAVGAGSGASSVPLEAADSGTDLPIPVRRIRPKLAPLQVIESLSSDECGGTSPYIYASALTPYARTTPTPVPPQEWDRQTHTTNKSSDCKSHDREEESRTWKQDLQQKLKTGLDTMKAGRTLPHVLPEIVREKVPQKQLPEVFAHSCKERPETKLEIFLEGGAFHAICAIVVLVNAVVIGIQVDFCARDALAAEPQGDPNWFQVADNFFLAFYILEVVIRIAAQRWRFICGDDWGWNAFDFILAFYSIFEEVMASKGVYANPQGFTYTPIFRVLRLVRIIRVLRVIRVVRFFRDLRLMTCSLIKTWVSLFWALALLILFVYIWTILFMQVTTAYVAKGSPQAPLQGKLQDYFGTVPLAMFSLVQAISGGNDWHVFVEPLAEISEIYKYCFVLYVLFVLVGLLNVLTSVFVERAREMSKLDVDLVIQGEMNSQQAFYEAMIRVFQEVQEKNGSSTDRITWQMFSEYLGDEHVRAYLATQQLDTWEARDLFDHLEAGERGVTLEEFVVGCAKLRGQAKSTHVATLLRETKRTRMRNEKILETLRRLKAEVQQLRTENGHSPQMYGPAVDMSISDMCSPNTRMSTYAMGSTPTPNRMYSMVV